MADVRAHPWIAAALLRTFVGIIAAVVTLAVTGSVVWALVALLAAGVVINAVVRPHAPRGRGRMAA
jgi:hypothetical protein